MNEDTSRLDESSRADGTASGIDGPTGGAVVAARRHGTVVTVCALAAAAALIAVFLVVEFGGGKEKRTSVPDTVPVAPVSVPSRTTAPPSPSASGPALDPDGFPIVSDTPTEASAPAETGTDAEESPVLPGWRETAEGFGRAFTDTSGGHQAWINRLVPFLTPEAAERYRRVPIEAVPSAALTRIDMSEPSGSVAAAVLTYDSGLQVDITLAHNGLEWEVATVVDRPRTGG